MEKTSSKCVYLWNHACLRSGAQALPCCQFDEKTIPDMRLGGATPRMDLILNSPVFQQLRAQSLKGEAIAGCHQCDEVEKLGHYSLRAYANSLWPQTVREGLTVKPSQTKYLEVFVGNTCNLKCLMCGPHQSTAWQGDYQKLGWTYPSSPSDETIAYDGLLEQLPGLEELKFVGGEPFLSKSHDRLLASIPADHAEKIKLVYYTNCTTVPSAQVFEALGRFRAVNIWLSIDGFGALNEYIRFPSRWPVVESTAREFMDFSRAHPRVQIGMHTTVNWYNVFSLGPLRAWFRALKAETGNTSKLPMVSIPLSNPEFLSVRHLPPALKPLAQERLDADCFMQARIAALVAEPTEPAVLDRFLDYTRALDRLRGNDFRSAAPELSGL